MSRRAWTRPGTPRRRGYDYVGHGALCAAIDIATGSVITAACRGHHAVEWLKLLCRIDKAVPPGLDVRIVCGGHAARKAGTAQGWSAGRKRFHAHFTVQRLYLSRSSS